jgi:hypothetical protein
MSTRTSFESTTNAVGNTKSVTLQANQLVLLESINQSGCNTGSLVSLQQNGNASYVSAVIAAVKAKQVSDAAAEATKQSSLAAARESLRSDGTDRGPV